MKKCALFIVYALIVLSFSSVCFADIGIPPDSNYTWHVAKDGNDSNGGNSYGQAMLTINAAIDAAASGDTIIIWPGSYAESLVLATDAKTLTFIGINRHSSIITMSSGETVATTYNNCKFKNLTINNTGTGATNRCLHISGNDDIELEDCDLISTGDMVIDGSSGKRLKMKNCFCYGFRDVIYVGEELYLDNCILVTNGRFPAAVAARTLRAVNTLPITKYISAVNSTLISRPSYRTEDAKNSVYYTTAADLTVLEGTASACVIILDNSFVIADGYKPADSNADSNSLGNSYCVSNVAGKLIAKNTMFLSRTDQNQSSKTAWGFYTSNVQLSNCVIDVSSEGASGVAYDFDASAAKIIEIINTRYNASQIGSNVTVKPFPDTNGRIDVGKWLGTAVTLTNSEPNVGGVKIAAILTDTSAQDTSTEIRTLAFGSDTPGATQSKLQNVAGDVNNIEADTAAVDTTAEMRTFLTGSDTTIATQAKQDTIIADTNENQTDWTDGGRLDTIIDSILTDTGTTLDDFLDTEIAAILADSNELQTDWTNGGRLDLIIDAILADGNDIQEDWATVVAQVADVNTDTDTLLVDVNDVETTVEALPTAAGVPVGQ